MSKDEEVFKDILSIKNKNQPPILNKVENRCLMLSPTVRASLEPEASMNDFEKEPREIGKGGFGEVWKVVHKPTQKTYCIKIIKKKGIIEQKLVDQMNREIEIMYLLNHPHCLKLKNHFEDDNNFYLVMPLATKGQLYRILKRCKKFDERTAAQILRETISALSYLHSFNPPIIHRDLKPENLLVNENGRIFLADFGWSNFKKDGDVRKTFCGTPEYIAPEMLRHDGHDHRVDIWSVGVLMFELLAGYSPFVAGTNDELYRNIRKLKIQWPLDMPPLAKNLISKILKINPKERLSFKEILEHKWFTSIPMIKPLLENELKTHKDQLMYHMLNVITPEIETKINKILQITDKVENVSTIPSQQNGKSQKRATIMKQIEKEKQKKPGYSSTPSTNNSSLNSNDSYGINVQKERNDSLLAEISKLKSEVSTLKTKLIKSQNELKNVKPEKDTKSEETIKKLTAEIERLQVMDKDRLGLLSELEEKNSNLRDLTAKVKMVENEKEQIEKDLEDMKGKMNELNKTIELKELTVEHLIKKIELITQEKEQQACEYEKKIEMLQLNIVDGAESDKSQSSLNKVMELLKESVDEAKNLFHKKFDTFVDNNEAFKREFNSRNKEFTSILNEKSVQIIDVIKKVKESSTQDIEKVFSSTERNTNKVNQEKIEWLNKQINELSVYKKKGGEYEKKLVSLQNEAESLKKMLETKDEEVKNLKGVIKLKETKLEKKRKKKKDLLDQIVDLKNFIFTECAECDASLLEKFSAKYNK